MQASRYARNISQVYLTLVPFLGLIIAFASGHSSYKIYLPIWLLHACLMLLAAWVLGGHLSRGPDANKKRIAVIGLFLIGPWVLISIFAGIGPLPANAAAWVATATEQQIRYYILIIAGLIAAGGFMLLREYLKEAGESLYSRLGSTAVVVATPLFIINMAFWGSYLTESYRLFTASASANRPDWYLPVRALFESITIVEVALIYVATIAFAVSMRRTSLLKPAACTVYILVSLVGVVLCSLPGRGVPAPLAIASFAVSIPAIPFIMPYLMAINLLRRVGN
ncbi:hypothetical protein [Hymenobacter chitinivorans]|uniref:Uncharacterized protein n=1 Tax=Hymenobacter chitinivorans DSM 11115 TaxID=1121954 RepID=A0A2M9BKZ7_9BACT|nr:hypothetical protein [Hymenobacter chitinivorans]PJJ58595.1 hypothetical protein CLV45_0005 [Hymenobacter chitinivorans DSM 11115]